jgi:hypothetical protein
VTAFRERFRLRQARWREANSLPIGHEPILGGPGARLLGSRIDICRARSEEELPNFITPAARAAAVYRAEHPEKHQALDRPRLWADLLSSMPMCFNLFGDLWRNESLADEAVHTWWPDTPGRVSAVKFEWSPGRRDRNYLNDRTSFDVAFILEDLPAGGRGVVGIETKYHEWADREPLPREDRLEHYLVVASRSKAHDMDMIKSMILGKDLQQLWRDHLLALSMPRQPPAPWEWARFVLVYPAENISFADAATRYDDTLLNHETFVSCTIEELLGHGVLPAASEFRQRYLIPDA